jgi:zinc D-Ala-D-Ala carboxypeptidase
MILRLTKGVSARISQHFRSTEFDCRCKRPECKLTLVSSVLLLGLEQLRGRAGALSVDSGFRCEAHNKEVGGVADSYHCRGLAADIRAGKLLPFSIASVAESILCFEKGGIGIYRAFVHLDVRGYKARWGSQTAC